VAERLKEQRHPMFAAMPTPLRVYAGVENQLRCPLTVREGRQWLSDFALEQPLLPLPEIKEPSSPGRSLVELSEIWFRYEKDRPDVLRGLSLSVREGEFFALLGGNGAGKTTLLHIIRGLIKPQRGKIKAAGEERLLKMALLPQNPQTLFTRSTLREDLAEMLKDSMQEVVRLCRLQGLLNRHPYDLSGGEQQRAALAKLLLMEPRLLLLDEPTKGMDAAFKLQFVGILQELTARGISIIMVSHDVEFCAAAAGRCALLFAGDIISQGAPREFFSGHSFYTTAANRMARHLLPLAVTADDIIRACGSEAGGQRTEDRISMARCPYPDAVEEGIRDPDAGRKWSEGKAEGGRSEGDRAEGDRSKGDRSEGDRSEGDRAEGDRSEGDRAEGDRAEGDRAEEGKTKTVRFRFWLTLAMFGLAIPLTIWFGLHFLADRRYFIISLLVLAEAMLPFLLLFERRKPQARELTLLAVLTALAVASRAAFAMLPQFKPMAALVIISGAALGPEAGFLVGALSAFISNFFFGQGPWTPWQMLGLGLMGFLAGLLFTRRLQLIGRRALCLYGGLSTYFIYAALMNPAAVLMFQSQPTKEMFWLAYVQGFPFDIVHMLATVVFLWILGPPMLEKLQRIKKKYGMLRGR
jgi:energy-coupling factor transport system ATP-binding protein